MMKDWSCRLEVALNDRVVCLVVMVMKVTHGKTMAIY